MTIDTTLTPSVLFPAVTRVFELSAQKIASIRKTWKPENGTPVFTVDGAYTSRGWTEWTQGFQFGSAILQFDATGDKAMLEYGRNETVSRMASHVSHTGVHDHGFNNVSTYGNLLRLMREGKIAENAWEKNFYELALKISGAVQAARWTSISEAQRSGPSNTAPSIGPSQSAGIGPSVNPSQSVEFSHSTETESESDPFRHEHGYIYSFNGPHSLFSDTIRSMRSLMIAHQLGHALMGERDRRINLLHRALHHAESTAKYNVYFGNGRDAYDVRGRVAHESIFNLNDGSYRCPSTQQGYSPFSTWTRGLAWVMLGFAEELEFLATLPESEFEGYGTKSEVIARFVEVAEATADFYIDNSTTDGIVYWDTGAPGLAKMGDYLGRPADPYNDYEPVDSSASVIAAQAFVRLGKFLERQASAGQRILGGRTHRELPAKSAPGRMEHQGADTQTAPDVEALQALSARADRYLHAGLTIARTLFAEPYLSADPAHQGLLLHSVYHRPNGWDHVPAGRAIMCSESSMWGDYHMRELALMLHRLAKIDQYYSYCL
ncbi:MAG TPA: glycosyl hydrolase [Bacteroidota bacterium]|nr:glycosyl hydrolase [Bacteroidota bacterium]